MHVLLPFSFSARWSKVQREGRAVPQATHPHPLLRKCMLWALQRGLRLPSGHRRVFQDGPEAAS